MAHLAWPIYVENLLRISLASVDVFMLSFYSTKAVAGVGLSNQFVMFMQVLYSMIAVGASILISQNIGAGRQREAGLFSLGSMALGSLFALGLSVIMTLSAAPILSQYHLEQEVYDAAWQFLVIMSAGSVFLALGLIQGTILRAHGYSRDPMYVNIGANLINILGNCIFIFGLSIGPIHIPVLGVLGVAISTVFAQFLACLVMFIRIRKRPNIIIPFRSLFKVPRALYRQILSIGVPTAGENLSYNIGQIVIMSMVAGMGTAAMSAFIYALTLVRFVFMPSLAIGASTQITVGHLIGAGDHDIAYGRVYRWWAVGFGFSLILILILNLVKIPVLHLFTHDPATLLLVSTMFLVSIFLEPGRNFNLIIISALKGAGDVRFPVFMGMLFMWGIGVGCAWLLGVHWGWGLVGVYIAMAMDEWVRGIIMVFRWRSGAWRRKSLVKFPG